ncbi:PIN domain-containing protein [Terricaulis sp.]|uniref:PIN domain-containing protein n=1 Tax=Terricaulis sp. TaxID=2768686 RepID=UPI00378433C3
MAKPTLYLFPDTNIFIQCKSLHEVDWRLLGDFDEFVLLICRSVQDEIDQQKGRGAGRVTDRARATSGVFRGMLKSGADKIERDAAPRVQLRMALRLKPTPNLGDLDYSDADDALVGCAHAYAAQNPSADVRVLTDDGGPMGSAVSIGFPVIDVPEQWLLPPEASPTEKKLAQAQAENARLRQTEPEIAIACYDATGAAITALALKHQLFAPLTDAQIAALMQKLKDIHPLETDFGPEEPPARTAPTPTGPLFTETWRPAKTEEVEAYRNKRYPEWLTKCEYELRHLHFKLEARQTPPLILFEAVNTGSRPASQVRVDVTAQGGVAVRPPAYKDDEDDADGQVATAAEMTLPRPPAAPYGRWERTPVRVSSALSALDLADSLRRQLDPFGARGFNPDGMFARASAFAEPMIPPIPHFVPPRHDPEGFYYKGGRPSEPSQAFALTCDLWRHAREPRGFGVELYALGAAPGDANGIVTLTVHADNLGAPADLPVPMKISIANADVYAEADQLVEALRPKFNLKALRGG